MYHAINDYFISADKGIGMSISLTIFCNCLMCFFCRGIDSTVFVRNPKCFFENFQRKKHSFVKFKFRLSALDSLLNSSLPIRYAVTNVGAVINRPAVKCCDSTSVFGEFVISYCRADDIRPYGVLSKTVRQTEICGSYRRGVHRTSGSTICPFRIGFRRIRNPLPPDDQWSHLRLVHRTNCSTN